MESKNKQPSNCPKCGAKMKYSYACGEYFIFPESHKGCSWCSRRKMRASEAQLLLEWEQDVLWYMENCK